MAGLCCRPGTLKPPPRKTPPVCGVSRTVPTRPSLTRWVFYLRVQVLHFGKLPTDCLQAHRKQKAHYRNNSGLFFTGLVPER